jgi:hypothetical protein
MANQAHPVSDAQSPDYGARQRWRASREVAVMCPSGAVDHGRLPTRAEPVAVCVLYAASLAGRGFGSFAVLSGAEPLPVQSTRGPGCRSETSAQPGSPPCRTLSPLPYPQPAFSVGVWACRGIIFAEFLAQLWEPGTPLSRATETLSLPTTNRRARPRRTMHRTRQCSPRVRTAMLSDPHWLVEICWVAHSGEGTGHSRDLAQEPTRQPGSAARMWLSAQPVTEIKRRTSPPKPTQSTGITSPPSRDLLLKGN